MPAHCRKWNYSASSHIWTHRAQKCSMVSGYVKCLDTYNNTFSMEVRTLVVFLFSAQYFSNCGKLNFSSLCPFTFHYFHTLGMPVDQFSLSCKKALASFRCQLCGPFGFYCWECFEACHGRTNLFHVVEKWEVKFIIINYNYLNLLV